MLPLAVALGTLGYLLAWSAVTGGSVADEFRALVAGDKSPARTQYEAERAEGGGGGWTFLRDFRDRLDDAPGAVDPDDYASGRTPGGTGGGSPGGVGSGGGGGGSGVADVPGGEPGTDKDGNPITLVKIGQGGHKLRHDAAAAFKRAEERAGRQIKVTDSYRSRAQQEDCYRRKPGTCAKPGGSLHESGLAVDIVEMTDDKIAQALAGVGFIQATWETSQGVREIWHWSYGIKG